MDVCLSETVVLQIEKDFSGLVSIVVNDFVVVCRLVRIFKWVSDMSGTGAFYIYIYTYIYIYIDIDIYIDESGYFKWVSDTSGTSALYICWVSNTGFAIIFQLMDTSRFLSVYKWCAVLSKCIWHVEILLSYVRFSDG